MMDEKENRSLLYRFIRRFFGGVAEWSLSRKQLSAEWLLGAGNRYDGFCLAMEFVMLATVGAIALDHRWLAICLCILPAIRWLEILSLVISALVIGLAQTARRITRIAPHYLLLLALVSYAEAITIFAIFYHLAGTVLPDAFNSHLSSLDALYLSVITAATVGYGDIHPTHWCTKLLVMAEVSSCFLIAVGAIGRSVSALGSNPEKSE